MVSRYKKKLAKKNKQSIILVDELYIEDFDVTIKKKDGGLEISTPHGNIRAINGELELDGNIVFNLPSKNEVKHPIYSGISHYIKIKIGNKTKYLPIFDKLEVSV